MNYSLLKSLLFQLPAETAHHVSLQSLKFVPDLLLPPIVNQPSEWMGINFPNRVGLAAGLDKNGDYINALAKCGFGFIEVGTVTPRPQAGNAKPRLFRLKDNQAIINRMGFNNKGVDYLVQKVKNRRFQGVLGINIGKNKDTPNEEALSDYLIGLEKTYPVADYITINISSPNTQGLRDLQQADSLNHLLSGLKKRQSELADQHKRYVPLALKVAPDLDEAAIVLISQALTDHNFDALIATNTSIQRPDTLKGRHIDEQGGLSGKPIKALADLALNRFARDFDSYKHKPCLIGCGGISDVADAQNKIHAGADLIQIYTGFIYQGPQLIHDCAQI